MQDFIDQDTNSIYRLIIWPRFCGRTRWEVWTCPSIPSFLSALPVNWNLRAEGDSDPHGHDLNFVAPTTLAECKHMVAIGACSG